MMKQHVILFKMEQNMSITYALVESTLVSRSIVVLLISQELREKLQLGVLMDLERDVQNTILQDADSLNGEQSLKLIKTVLLIQLFKKLLILQLVMELSVKKMDLSLSSNPKFFKMEIMILKFVLRFLKKFSQLLCSNY